jgi:glutaconate CoA-transferase subunit A
MEQSKVAKLTEINKIIKNGDLIAIGGAWLGNHPMAAIRQIIRSGIKDLTAVTIVSSIDMDLLIGAGSLKKVMFSFISMEALG